MQVLRSDLKLVIDDFGANASLSAAVRAFYDFKINCMAKENMSTFVTSREYV